MSDENDLFFNEKNLFTELVPELSGPLAEILRPKTLDDVIGHESLTGPKGQLRSWIKNHRFPSILFWGPPGVGKTSIARALANTVDGAFIALSAIHAGVKDIKEAAEKARRYRSLGRRTFLFFDEIHRLNKSQQDALLPEVESGLVTLIGATTENPSYEINSALLSRLRVVTLKRLNKDALEIIFSKVFADAAPNSPWHQHQFLPEARDHLLSLANGDARRLLTTLDALCNPDTAGEWSLEKTKTQLDALGPLFLPHDKNGSHHHDLISAFIKSMRASDPDAAIYYLARMIEGGEDPLFIARRCLVFASEDIGNADPRALLIADAGFSTVERIGLPEARITLAHVAVSLALAKKSRSVYDAIESALAKVRETGTPPVPPKFQNSKIKTHHPKDGASNLPEDEGVSG